MIADPFLDVLDEDEYGEMVAWELDSGFGWEPDESAFNKAYLPYLDNMARIQIYFGGSSSGKSVFLAQRDVRDILRGGRNFLICREVANTLRKSVFAEIKKVIGDWGLNGRFTVNKSEMTITCDNGYQILFAGLDDVEKLKSITPEKGVITDVRIEEATESKKDSVKQLLKRQRGGDPSTPKRLTMSFNPILKLHWIYKEYFKPLAWLDKQTKYISERLTILKTWYVHNEFLTPNDIYDLENEEDEYYRDVYTFGNWGVLGDVIFKNWRVEDLSGMHNQFTNGRNGLDFGFNKPNAMPVTHYDKPGKKIYIFDEFYESELTNDVIAERIIEKIGRDYVTCDSAEPKSIAALQKLGVRALPAAKGKDSIIFGIKWLKKQTIIIDKKCINAINEFQLYQWKKDKDGEAMEVPIDKKNHLIDALRYAYERDMEESQATHRQGRVKGRGGNGRRIKARVR